VREAARAAALRFAIVAEDTSDNSNDKLLPLLSKRGVPHVVAFTRAQLGAAVGQPPLSAIGVTSDSFADQLAGLFESGDSLGGTE
jgi:ribosomal protein L7Ae-like RNA K-turn-binding protein